MRRHTSVFLATASLVVLGVGVSIVPAQQLFQSRGSGDSSESVPTLDPMLASRGPSYLLRHGLDYVKYKRYSQALGFLRNAEKRQAELNDDERKALKQGIVQAQKGLREVGAPVTRTSSNSKVAKSGRAASRPGAFAYAEPADGVPSLPASRRDAKDRASEPIRLTGGVSEEPDRKPADKPSEIELPPPRDTLEVPPALEPIRPEPPAAPKLEPKAPTLPSASEPPVPSPIEPKSQEPSRDEKSPPVLTLEPLDSPTAPVPVPVPDPKTNAEPKVEPKPVVGTPEPKPEPPALELPPIVSSAPPSIDAAASPSSGVEDPKPAPVARPDSDGLELPPLPADGSGPASPPEPLPGQSSPSRNEPRADAPPPVIGLETVPNGPEPPAPTPLPSEPTPPIAPPATAESERPISPTPEPVPAATAVPRPVVPDREESSAPPPAAEELPAKLPEREPVADSIPEVFPSEESRPPASRTYKPLTPELEEEVARIARLQDEAARRREQNPPPSTPLPAATLPGEDTGSPRYEIPRPPSSTEGRPLRKIPLPEEFVPLTPREWEPIRKYWAAPGVCHMPLYFQDVMLERYGKSIEDHLGPKGYHHATYPLDDPTQSTQRNQLFQPFFSAGLFAGQVLALPYQVLVDPPWEAQYDLGFHRPGDKIPPGMFYLPTHGTGPALHGKNY